MIWGGRMKKLLISALLLTTAFSVEAFTVPSAAAQVYAASYSWSQVDNYGQTEWVLYYDGQQVYGWQYVNGVWYYINYFDGYMAHDTTIDGYYVNSNGVYEDSNSVQSGYYKVGVDIDPGEYLIISGDSYGYYECTLDQSGSVNSIVYNNVLMGNEPSYITVNYGEYLKVDNSRMYKIADAPSIKPSNNVYTDGQYKVGRDIPAGTYTVSSVGANGTVQVNPKSRHNPDDATLFESLYGGSLTITVGNGDYIELTGAQIIA